MEKHRPDPIGEMEFEYDVAELSSSLKIVKIAPTSDIHYGNPSCSLRHLNQHIEYIKANPEVFTFLNGDMIESVTKFSKGEIHKQVGSPGDQRDFIVKLFKPIKHKVLGVTQGNHERRIEDVDVAGDIAQELDAPYRAEGMLLKISFGGGNAGHPEKPYAYWGYFTHGYGGARTKAAKAVKVERTGYWIHADFYVMSHDHVVNVSPDIYLLPDNRTHIDKETGRKKGKLKAHRKMEVKSNAFLKWGGYAEAGGFPPSDLTTPLIILDGKGKPRVRVEV
tara:strand:- start:628 stop:1461 length:834 start_codon:yes stop_codon:yes gene_type:complete